MFQKVCHPRRCVHPMAILAAKAQVHPAVTGGKEGKLLAIFRPHIHQDLQSVVQPLAVDIFPQQRVFPQFHLPYPSSPVR